MLSAHVNENCIGCGLCASLVPDVFAIAEEGVARGKDRIRDGQADAVREAADSCPVDAIELEED